MNNEPNDNIEAWSQFLHEAQSNAFEDRMGAKGNKEDEGCQIETFTEFLLLVAFSYFF